jgi:hypothetical protein
MRGRSMTSARYDAAAHWRRRGFLADDFERSGGLIVEPLRRSPGVLYMCIGLIDRGAPETERCGRFHPPE